MDLVDRSFPGAEGVPKSFDGDVDSDFVPVLEAISHGLRRSVDLDSNSLNLVRLDPFDESAAGEPHHSKGRRLNGRFVSFEIDCDPDLVRVLSRQAVEAKRRQKTNDAARN